MAENRKPESLPGREIPLPPLTQSTEGVVSINFRKLNMSGVMKVGKGEVAKMTQHLRHIRSQIQHHKVLISRKVVFAWGDWSSFPHRGSDRYVFSVSQFESMERYEAYRKIMAEDPVAKRSLEFYHPIAGQALSTRDITLFQN